MRVIVLCLVLALFAGGVSGCSGNKEEERKAFIVFLSVKVLPRKGVALPELTREEKRSFGDGADLYALLLNYQKTMAEETGKNAKELLGLAAIENLEALAKAERSLKKAMAEAEKLQALAVSLREKTNNAKAKMNLPEDLASVYNAVYDKVVTLPADASAAAFGAARASFAATLALLDFIDTNSRDMEVVGASINLKNLAFKDDLQAKMDAVRVSAADLRRAYAAMMQVMFH